MTILNNSVVTRHQDTCKNRPTKKLLLPLILASSVLLIACEEDNDIVTTVTPTKPPITEPARSINYTYGARPFYLVNDMDEGALKDELLAADYRKPKARL